MHLERFWIEDDGGRAREHSFAAASESIRRWTLLKPSKRTSELMPLLALACTGHRHAETLADKLALASAVQGRWARLESTLVYHAAQEIKATRDPRRITGWQIGQHGQVRLLPSGEPSRSDPIRKLRKPHSGAGNGGCLLLGYGPSVPRQPLSDTFDFADRHHRLRRFAGLFDPRAPLTDPVAFLKRLHHKGVLYEKERSLNFITRLAAALAKVPGIKPSAWLEKDCDFDRLWQTAPRSHREILIVLLDVARHVLDAAIAMPDPFQQSGVVLMDGVAKWRRAAPFKNLVEMLDGLFPSLQFIISAPDSFREVLPRRIIEQTLPIPSPSPSPSPRKRARLPPKTILLVDVDSALPNLALMKLSRHFKEQGKRVALARRTSRLTHAEGVFASCVFAFPQSARRVEALRRFYGGDLNTGGSGVDIKLRLAPGIENLPPDYSLYPEMGDRALGFLTRGCPLHCPFCIVPIKEGKPRLVSDFDSLLQGRKKLVLLDDNILSHAGAVELMEEMLRRDLAVNFNQTLDLRFITPVTADLLRRIRCSNVSFTRRNYYFSLNNTRGLERLRERYQLLNVTRRDNVEFVAMYGFDTTLAQDVERFQFLRSLPGAYVFLQRYRPVLGKPEADLSHFFDDDADEHIDALLKVNFAQNMKSMEVYYRWVCLEYARQRGRIHMELVETLYRYNNRHRMGEFLLKLERICRQSNDGAAMPLPCAPLIRPLAAQTG